MDWFEGFGARLYRAFIEKGRYMAYFDGIYNTLIISFFAVLLGVLIGLIVAIVKYKCEGKKGLLKLFDRICDLYIYIIRGTPVMVQLLIIYNMVFVSRATSPILSGVVCFGINSGAYVAEIIRAGIMSVDRGQMEAGRSLGLDSNQSMLYIVLPQAVKNILPALGNEFIVLLKETSIAGVIAITDVTKAAQYVGTATYDILPPLFIAAAFYLIIVLGLTKLLKSFERRLGKSDRR